MEGAKKTIETGEMGQKRRFAPEAHCRKFSEQIWTGSGLTGTTI
jgi:hypothetical protein